MAESTKEYSKITIRSLLIGALFAGFFAFVTAYLENRRSLYLSATQIAVLPYILLLAMVVLINPLIRAIRFLPRFSSTETLIIFIMGSVSAGISTFGLTSQVGPVIGSMFNRHWNNDQSGWHLNVTPFVNESFFISEPGIQNAAIVHREAKLAVDEARSIYDVALRDQNAEAAVTKATATLDKLNAEGADALALGGAKERLNAAHVVRAEAATEWAELSKEHDLSSAQTIIDTWKPKIESLQAETDSLRNALRQLEQRAFDKVDVFRRGLPDGKVAMPGFFFRPGDSWDSYVQRFNRLRHGRKALSHLEKADAIFNETVTAGMTMTAEQRQQLESLADQAMTALEPINIKTEIEAAKRSVDQRWQENNAELLKTQDELLEKQNARRLAVEREFDALDRDITTLKHRAKKLKGVLKGIESTQASIRQQLTTTGGIVTVITAITAWKSSLSDAENQLEKFRAPLGAIIAKFPGLDASMSRYLVGDIPWGDVLPPFLRWAGLIFLTYLVLMAFNLLIFRQWAHNERLIYPLAELPELLAVTNEENGQRLPDLFTNPLFWVGFAISGGVLGWNLICFLELVPGLAPLDLNNQWREIVQDSVLQPLSVKSKSTVFFTMIGLSFLIPAKISFSLWFFTILYMVQVLILCWLGYGQTENSFPMEWWYTLNFRGAEGAGGMMIFAAVVFYKARKYLFCFFSPSAVSDLEADEQKELRISSFCFIFGSVGLILMLWRGMGANLFWCIFGFIVILIITIGLVRAVTEGGVLGFQAWVSPFHLIRTLWGMDKAWTAPPLFAPLFIYYSVFFLDIKTFIAPAMANCIKIRDDLKMERFRFHIAIFSCIVVAAIVAITTHLLLTYNKGGDNMNGWFYTGFPKGMFEQVGVMVKTSPIDTTKTSWFFGGGAVAMMALLYFRQMFFWLPHPIGMIMLVNPIMNAYWFSILIGWLAKVLVTRYGNKDTYRIVRGLFVGLIVGELMIILAALIGSLVTGNNVPIDLNRN
ncbi:MAG TPA: hypothetical protein DIT01_14100, partial [Lentisphaeria bacterium]|nr:hypothetical protein [Lentisphaeria bacterium]|tara:strand:- start:346 stop:3321 length:2976 start_codon:yes stop_codon:yes gene_type:complete